MLLTKWSPMSRAKLVLVFLAATENIGSRTVFGICMSNSNNWFSFSLPQDTREDLHRIALKISSDRQEVFADETIEFRPMSLGEMHMTLCYFGERMQHMKRETLANFHENLTKEIQASECSSFAVLHSRLTPRHVWSHCNPLPRVCAVSSWQEQRDCRPVRCS